MKYKHLIVSADENIILGACLQPKRSFYWTYSRSQQTIEPIDTVVGSDFFPSVDTFLLEKQQKINEGMYAYDRSRVDNVIEQLTQHSLKQLSYQIT